MSEVGVFAPGRGARFRAQRPVALLSRRRLEAPRPREYDPGKQFFLIGISRRRDDRRAARALHGRPCTVRAELRRLVSPLRPIGFAAAAASLLHSSFLASSLGSSQCRLDKSAAGARVRRGTKKPALLRPAAVVGYDVRCRDAVGTAGGLRVYIVNLLWVGRRSDERKAGIRPAHLLQLGEGQSCRTPSRTKERVYAGTQRLRLRAC